MVGGDKWKNNVCVCLCVCVSHRVLFLQAILQQWESELMKDGGEGESQYIVVNGTPHWAQNGYAIVSGARSDNDRPRIRGCLKHVSDFIVLVITCLMGFLDVVAMDEAT